MAVKIPTAAQLRDVATRCGLALSEEDVESFRVLFTPYVAAYELIDQMPDEVPAVKYPRTPGVRPAAEENSRNAWARKVSIKGAASGPLQGKRVAIKDNVMVAGVPMMNGSATLEGYIPDFDATIVTRILDAGGEIVGKTTCECLCLSGGSHTSAPAAVHNPHRTGFSAGGSSSGSAVVVALGEADMAIGGDQGGSIRMPSSFCGTYGMKPTWGLVPYTGIMPIEIFIDHTGPITASVEDNAALLEVIGGDDGYDPRIKAPRMERYVARLDEGVRGLRIGVLAEGFGHAASEPELDALVRSGANRLAKLGADVREVSVPMHLQGPVLWTPIGIEGLTQTMMWGDGYGLSRSDLYSVSLIDFHHGWRQRADELSETAKLFLLFGTYVHQLRGPHYYGKAINIVRRLTAAYDRVLAECDLLLMPTTPMRATSLPAAHAPRDEYVTRALEMTINTMPFDLSHHPAMSLPCGMLDGLPVGLMLVGRHFEEATIYRAAAAFARSEDWRQMR